MAANPPIEWEVAPCELEPKTDRHELILEIQDWAKNLGFAVETAWSDSHRHGPNKGTICSVHLVCDQTGGPRARDSHKSHGLRNRPSTKKAPECPFKIKLSCRKKYGGLWTVIDGSCFRHCGHPRSEDPMVHTQYRIAAKNGAPQKRGVSKDAASDTSGTKRQKTGQPSISRGQEESRSPAAPEPAEAIAYPESPLVVLDEDELEAPAIIAQGETQRMSGPNPQSALEKSSQMANIQRQMNAMSTGIDGRLKTLESVMTEMQQSQSEFQSEVLNLLGRPAVPHHGQMDTLSTSIDSRFKALEAASTEMKKSQDEFRSEILSLMRRPAIQPSLHHDPASDAILLVSCANCGSACSGAQHSGHWHHESTRTSQHTFDQRLAEARKRVGESNQMYF